ncbi:MAG: hypothetical protein LBG98_00910 [Puniceicoccales bacterium]|nr:hypothetical protein [Puniceicoccales bacterium]
MKAPALHFSLTAKAANRVSQAWELRRNSTNRKSTLNIIKYDQYMCNESASGLLQND